MEPLHGKQIPHGVVIVFDNDQQHPRFLPFKNKHQRLAFRAVAGRVCDRYGLSPDEAFHWTTEAICDLLNGRLLQRLSAAPEPDRRWICLLGASHGPHRIDDVRDPTEEELEGWGPALYPEAEPEPSPRAVQSYRAEDVAETRERLQGYLDAGYGPGAALARAAVPIIVRRLVARLLLLEALRRRVVQLQGAQA